MFSLLRRRIPHVIERLRIEHAPDCARLHALYFSHSWSVSELENLIASENVYGGAAIDAGGALLGFIMVRKAADEAEILTIAVDKPALKQGIGRALLEFLIETLRRLPVRRLFLEVDEGNVAARQLYSKMGFAQVGMRPAYYRNAKGAPSNALILARGLE